MRAGASTPSSENESLKQTLVRIFFQADSVGLCRLRCREKLPAPWPERHPALLRCRMVDGQLDLDPLALAADFELHPPGAGDAAAGRNRPGDATAAAVKELDVMRAEIKQGVARGRMRGGQADRPVGNPDLAALDLDRKRTRFTDEAVDKGRVRRVVDLIG